MCPSPSNLACLSGQFEHNLHRRCNLTSVSNTCEAVPTAMSFVTGQSWYVLKSWYTGDGPERGFWRCFTEPVIVHVCVIKNRSKGATSQKKALSFTSLLLGVDITKRVDDSIHRIFLDPTARHLIVCMKSQESFYLARNSKKPKPLAKMKVWDQGYHLIVIKSSYFINS